MIPSVYFFRSFPGAARAAGLAGLVLLSACGGGGGDGLPAPLSAAQAADDLSRRAGYPAVLAVRVSARTSEVEVRGVRTVGGAAARPGDFFPVGSITKSMTATLAALLVQQGLIGWDSQLFDVLPELAATARSEYAAVTLRDLLAHRSGLFAADTPAAIAQLPALEGSPTRQRLQLAAWATQRAPAVPPRARPSYSNGGYVVAAAMLERVAGSAYEALLRERLFAPLGAEVAFGSPGAPGEPRGHARDRSGAWQPADPAAPGAELPAFANPAGGAKLRGDDLASYLQLHLRALTGETGLVLTPASARELHAIVRDGYAMGWMAGDGLDGRPLSWHNGSDDASYYALAAVGPSQGRGAAVVLTGMDAGSEAQASSALARLTR